MLSDGFFLSLSLCLDIGLVNVAILSLTLSHGFKPGFWLGLGSCFGDLVYAALALAGMAVLLQFEAVRWVVWLGGGAVLLYLTWKMAREALFPPPAATAGGEDADAAPQASSPRSFLRGMLLAMSSPSAILWFAAVGGALIAKAGAT
ncbi:MAG: LysE family transporter, partial [Paraburkholderia tropica]